MKMRFGIKGLAGVMLAGALCLLGVVPVFAAGTVSSLSLVFEDRYETGEIQEPEITCRTLGVSVDSVEWSKDAEDWTPGKKVTATLTLSSDDGRSFLSSYGTSSCKVSGATLVLAKGDGATAQVKVSYYPVVQLDSPDRAGWSAADRMKATWKKVEYATGYQIRLYRDDIYLRTLTVTGTSKDLSEYMTKEGYYYYEIRAIGKDTNDAKYRKSSEYIMSTDQAMDDMGDTEGRWKNYIDGKKYQAKDGTEITGQWFKIKDKWYYFDENGYAVTGWKQLGPTWYYMDPSGVMLTGWQKVDNVWYYLNGDGSMATGWRMTAPGQWYYLNPDGSMAADTIVDGKHLNASGLCID